MCAYIIFRTPFNKPRRDCTTFGQLGTHPRCISTVFDPRSLAALPCQWYLTWCGHRRPLDILFIYIFHVYTIMNREELPLCSTSQYCSVQPTVCIPLRAVLTHGVNHPSATHLQPRRTLLRS